MQQDTRVLTQAPLLQLNCVRLDSIVQAATSHRRSTAPRDTFAQVEIWLLSRVPLERTQAALDALRVTLALQDRGVDYQLLFLYPVQQDTTVRKALVRPIVNLVQAGPLTIEQERLAWQIA